MKKLKVITIVGTRPEIIRLSCVIPKLDEYCEHILVHTGQNHDYELNQIFFHDLKIRKPDYFLDSANNSSSPSQTIGNVISSVDKIFSKIKPDAILILGDTNSCLSAIPAKKRKIPIFHMEAGNRCFDQRVPEETNRKIVDHIADINMTYSTIARDYLIMEGIPPDMIIKTGSPMYEVIEFYKGKIDSSDILRKLNLEKEQYFLVSAHREENIESDTHFKKFINVLNFLCDEYQLKVLVSTHPRTEKRIQELTPDTNESIIFNKPFSFSEYLNLQINSKAVLSDSGTITEESSILNFPALNIREAHERPEGMEEGSVMMVGMEISTIKQALCIIDKQGRSKERMLSIVNDYEVHNVSEKVLRIILSYTDYVNKKVWKKHH